MSIPLALSSQGWTAAAAVGGALVGATAGGLVEWVMGKARVKREARAGARLLAADLRMVDECLSEVERDPSGLTPFFVFSTPSWESYRSVLAAELNDNDFLAVASVAMALGEISKHTADGDGRTDVERFERAIKYLDIPAIRNSVAAGYNALSVLTGHAQVSNRLSQERSRG